MAFILILTRFPIQFFMPLSLLHPHVVVPLCVVVLHLFYSCLPWSLVGDKTPGLSLSLHSIHILLFCPFLRLPYVISSLMHPHVRDLCVFLPQLSHQRLLRSLLVISPSGVYPYPHILQHPYAIYMTLPWYILKSFPLTCPCLGSLFVFVPHPSYSQYCVP